MKKINALAVYCGANFNGEPALLEAVQLLAAQLVHREIRLVYGGGSVGLMGVIADEVLRLGGKVTGVIPRFLMEKEVGHLGLTELIVTGNMHERKQRMADISDGFLVLPGGFGTMEEFFEVLTWLQLGLHAKPIGVMNVNGFYDPLFQQLDLMVEHRFLKAANRDLVMNESAPEVLLEKMEVFSALPDDVWFRERNLT